MKLFLIICAFVYASIIGNAQPFPKVTYNYKNCSLTVKINKWIKDNGRDVLLVDAILSNNSNDTLKWASELCFEGKFGYLADTTNFSPADLTDDCLKNWPITELIPPHKSKTSILRLIKKETSGGVVKLQLATTLELVNIDIHQEMIERVYKQDINAFKTNYEMYEKQLEQYKKQEVHTFLSNVITVQ